MNRSAALLSAQNIRVFIAVVEVGSLSAAADRLGMSQPAISAAIKSLEQWSRIRLLERGKFGARPTPAGRVLYNSCLEIAAKLDDAEQAMVRARAGGQGSIRVGVIPAIAASVAGPVMRQYLSEHPSIDIQLVEKFHNDLMADLTAEKLDVVITQGATTPASVFAKVIGEMGEMLIARRRDDDSTHMVPIAIEDIPRRAAILQPYPNVRREAILPVLSARGGSFETIIDIQSMATTLEFIANSDFVTILPDTMVLREICTRTLLVRPILDLKSVIIACTRHRALESICQDLISDFSMSLTNVRLKLGARQSGK